MIRLAVLSVLTLAGVVWVLAGAHVPDGAAQAAGYVTPVTEPGPVVVETTTEPEPEPEAAPEAAAAPAVVSDERDDTRMMMPGPRLKRSPEFAWKDAQQAATGSAPQADAAVGADTRFVTAASVNLRGGPSTRNAIVGKVSRGDAVTLAGAEESGWFPVVLADGRTRGYLSAQFLSTTAP
ncbi:SH3 domain-containing protein [Paracoccus sp. p4-l81]|uniref:SH3 domain-containing protein n=1 Tax=unclassified Paracoccus (in: a-proteobacteria) TaxID=2688777 RepID=UPI0035B7F570